MAGKFPVLDNAMAARSFIDSTGRTWDVFEVHRASKKAGAVSPGLEEGWLAFASGENKRRLAPFPAEWADFTDAQLESLCEGARQAPVPRYPLHEPVRPRIRRSRYADLDSSPGIEATAAIRESESTPAAPVLTASPAEGNASEVEATVRGFAREARARGLPAVAAMLELKALLEQRHPEAGSLARDRKLVRRWFVESYYFDRDA